MKTKKVLPIAVLAMAMGSLLVGCGSKQAEEQSKEPEVSVKEEKIVVKAADNKTKVTVGDTVQLTSSIEGVSWESADVTIATVNDMGLVTTLKAGKVKIFAKKDGCKDGSIELTIELVKLTLTAAGEKTTLVQGETVQLTASQAGASFVSSATDVASVSATGLVTALKAGETTITASKEGFQDATIKITVTRPAATATLHFEDAAHYSADGFWEVSSRGPIYTPVYEKEGASDGTCVGYFGEGDKETLTFTSSAAVRAELTMKILYYNAFEDLGTCYNIKFNDADVSIAGTAYVGNSEVQEISLGEHNLKVGENKLEITMTGVVPYLDDMLVYAAGQTNIAVVAAPAMEDIAVTETEFALTAGDTAQITCTTEGVAYASSKETVATVSETGLITAVAKGTATISITKAGMKSKRITVTVAEVIAAGEIRVEAETGTVDGEALSAETTIKTRTASTGETLTERWAAEATLTLKATVSAAGSYQLYLNARAGGQYGTANIEDLSTVIEVKVNNVAVPVTGAISGRTFADYLLGTVALTAGENTITIKAIGEDNTAPNIDYVKLVPATPAA